MIRLAIMVQPLHFFVMDVTKIFAMLFLIIYVMGLLRAFLSPERVREYVRNRPDWQARGMAVTLGAVTPFCSWLLRAAVHRLC